MGSLKQLITDNGSKSAIDGKNRIVREAEGQEVTVTISTGIFKNKTITFMVQA